VSDVATLRLATRIAQLPRTGLQIRPVVDDDGPALTRLISAAYDEYACGPLDPEVFDADLARPATAAAARDRRWWIVLDRAVVPQPPLVACVAHGPLRTSADGSGTLELHRLYLAPEVRGAGLATALIEGIAAEAQLVGAKTLEAWSDSRLIAAHARYLATGFRQTEQRRELGDPAGTTELQFLRPLDPRESH
jgi:GNAT superfamily N-acetyltransferase